MVSWYWTAKLGFLFLATFVLSRLASSIAEDGVVIKISSIGNPGSSAEGSIRDVELVVNDNDTLLTPALFTGDDWTIFWNPETAMCLPSCMSRWGYVRDFGARADVYGDQEGIWKWVSLGERTGRLEIELSLWFKFGGQFDNPIRFYRIEVGVGMVDVDEESFTVMATLDLRPTLDVPGHRDWRQYDLSFVTTGPCTSNSGWTAAKCVKQCDGSASRCHKQCANRCSTSCACNANPPQPETPSPTPEPTTAPSETSETPAPTTGLCTSKGGWTAAKCVKRCDGPASRCHKQCANKCSTSCACNENPPQPETPSPTIAPLVTSPAPEPTTAPSETSETPAPTTGPCTSKGGWTAAKCVKRCGGQASGCHKQCANKCSNSCACNANPPQPETPSPTIAPSETSETTAPTTGPSPSPTDWPSDCNSCPVGTSARDCVNLACPSEYAACGVVIVEADEQDGAFDWSGVGSGMIANEYGSYPKRWTASVLSGPSTYYYPSHKSPVTIDGKKQYEFEKYYVQLVHNETGDRLAFDANICVNPPNGFIDRDGMLAKFETFPEIYALALKIISDNGHGIQFFHWSYVWGAYGGKDYIDTSTASMSTLMHECGHTLEQHRRLMYGDTRILNPKWRRAIECDDIRTSAYGNNNEWEDMAEFARLYSMYLVIGELSSLKEQSPERFYLWNTTLVIAEEAYQLETPSPTTGLCTSKGGWTDATCVKRCGGQASGCHKRCSNKCSTSCACNVNPSPSRSQRSASHLRQLGQIVV